MKYIGKLYGKLGGKYFPTGKTSEDWDELETNYNEAIEVLKGSQQVIEWLVVNGEFQPEHFETLHNSTQNQLNEIIELTYKHESTGNN